MNDLPMLSLFVLFLMSMVSAGSAITMSLLWRKERKKLRILQVETDALKTENAYLRDIISKSPVHLTGCICPACSPSGYIPWKRMS